MDHGIQAYYEARARSARRVSLCSLGVSIVFLSALLAWLLPPLHRATEEVRILRFGFQGPTQLVDLMQVEARPGVTPRLTDVGKVESAGARRGGGERGEGGVSAPTGRPDRSAGRSAPGEDLGDAQSEQMRRALRGDPALPVFQSQDLVIEHLVRPTYPEEAKEKDVEGRVGVIVRIDTLGNVVEAAVRHSSRSRLLDRAARSAALKCRFRPYLDNGRPKEVLAEMVFRFWIDY